MAHLLAHTVTSSAYGESLRHTVESYAYSGILCLRWNPMLTVESYAYGIRYAYAYDLSTVCCRNPTFLEGPTRKSYTAGSCAG